MFLVETLLILSFVVFQFVYIRTTEPNYFTIASWCHVSAQCLIVSVNTYIALLIYRLCDHSDELHNSSFSGPTFKTSFSGSISSDGDFVETMDLRILRNLIKEVCDETNAQYGNVNFKRFSLDNSTRDNSIRLEASEFILPDKIV
jgi:hypothetical protein